jgi:hypothetical protein
MGFLSKLMKNPIVQMALPMALTGGASALFGGTLGAKLGIGSLFSGMNPLMANALKQTALGYGTAALSGSRRPGKAAMAAGLTSIPFSYLSAANAAKGFNQANQGLTQPERYLVSPEKTNIEKFYGYQEPDLAGDFFSPNQQLKYRDVVTPAQYGFRDVPFDVPKISAMDVLTSSDKLANVRPNVYSPESFYSDSPTAMGSEGLTRIATPGESGKYFYGSVVPGEAGVMPSADIFSKPEMTEVVTADPISGLTQKQMVPTGTFKTDFLPTAVSQAAGLYAGRDTPEEEFEAAKRRRRKELAFMYGVDESLIEGEMDNPFYTGAMMNAGGIASLNMDMGGNVSGPGGPKDDMIDAKLSDGEFVMTAKAVENFGNGDRYAGAKKMYQMMNKLDPESEKMSEV